LYVPSFLPSTPCVSASLREPILLAAVVLFVSCVVKIDPEHSEGKTCFMFCTTKSAKFTKEDKRF